MFVLFYAVEIVYICDLFHILLSLWHTSRSMECMYICTYVIVNKMVCPQVHIWAMLFVPALRIIIMALKIVR